MKTLMIIVLAAIVPASVFAQLKTYKWSGEMCEYVGTYDSRKYSEQQIRDTVRLASGEFELIRTETTAFEWDGIDKLSVAELEKEYQPLRRALVGLKVVKDPYWQKMWKDEIAKIDRVHMLSRATILGYKEPVRLRDVNFAPSCVRDYAEPLIAGGQQLLDTWLKVNLDSRLRNSDPERMRRQYEAERASADRLKYARVEVMAFGWWNCGNEYARGDNRDDVEIHRRVKMLFKRLKETCEEP